MLNIHIKMLLVTFYLWNSYAFVHLVPWKNHSTIVCFVSFPCYVFARHAIYPWTIVTIVFVIIYLTIVCTLVGNPSELSVYGCSQVFVSYCLHLLHSRYSWYLHPLPLLNRANVCTNSHPCHFQVYVSKPITPNRPRQPSSSSTRQQFMLSH
jgi:hypothetical protein